VSYYTRAIINTVMRDMVEILERFEPPTEFVVSPHVTALQLTAYMDALVDGQVHALADLYRRLTADFERQSRHIRRPTRDAWVTKNPPTAGAAEPSAIRRRLERLPARPPNDDDRTEAIAPDGDAPSVAGKRQRGCLRIPSPRIRRVSIRRGGLTLQPDQNIHQIVVAS
jgi:hypothetical protein